MRIYRGTGKPCKALIQSKGISNPDVQELVSSEDDIGASSSSSGIYPVQTIHHIIIMQFIVCSVFITGVQATLYSTYGFYIVL